MTIAIPPRLRRVPTALLLGVLFLLMSAAPTAAQVNTEKLRAFDVDGLALTLGGDVAFESGNADLFEVGAAARLDAQQGRHYAFLTGSIRYGEQDGSRFKDRAFAHLRYNVRLLSWLVGEAFTQIERDGFKLLQRRFLIGGGARLRYVDAERLKLFQGTGLMFEDERLDVSQVDAHPAHVSTARWSNYVNLRLRLTDKTYAINTVYVQPRLDTFSDVRVLDEASLAIALTDHLTLTTTFSLAYDSRPPDDVEDLDLALRNGVQVTF